MLPPFWRGFFGFFGKGTKKSIFAVLKRYINTINSALLNFSSGKEWRNYFLHMNYHLWKTLGYHCQKMLKSFRGHLTQWNYSMKKSMSFLHSCSFFRLLHSLGITGGVWILIQQLLERTDFSLKVHFMDAI